MKETYTTFRTNRCNEIEFSIEYEWTRSRAATRDHPFEPGEIEIQEVHLLREKRVDGKVTMEKVLVPYEVWELILGDDIETEIGENIEDEELEGEERP